MSFTAAISSNRFSARACRQRLMRDEVRCRAWMIAFVSAIAHTPCAGRRLLRLRAYGVGGFLSGGGLLRREQLGLIHLEGGGDLGPELRGGRALPLADEGDERGAVAGLLGQPRGLAPLLPHHRVELGFHNRLRA